MKIELILKECGSILKSKILPFRMRVILNVLESDYIRAFNILYIYLNWTTYIWSIW